MKSKLYLFAIVPFLLNCGGDKEADKKASAPTKAPSTKPATKPPVAKPPVAKEPAKPAARTFEDREAGVLHVDEAGKSEFFPRKKGNAIQDTTKSLEVSVGDKKWKVEVFTGGSDIWEVSWGEKNHSLHHFLESRLEVDDQKNEIRLINVRLSSQANEPCRVARADLKDTKQASDQCWPKQGADKIYDMGSAQPPTSCEKVYKGDEFDYYTIFRGDVVIDLATGKQTIHGPVRCYLGNAMDLEVG